MLTLDEVIALAQLWNNNTSSRLRLDDAFNLRDKGQLSDARRAALDSLRHSVGILHADFGRASEAA